MKINVKVAEGRLDLSNIAEKTNVVLQEVEKFLGQQHYPNPNSPMSMSANIIERDNYNVFGAIEELRAFKKAIKKEAVRFNVSLKIG